MARDERLNIYSEQGSVTGGHNFYQILICSLTG
jgi:hypothetical protein